MAPAHTHLACPTELVDAPMDVVWSLLLDTAGWGGFYDLVVLSVDPPGPARAGQRIVGNPGPKFLPLRLVFNVTDVDLESHRLKFDGSLPFGIRVREDLTIVPVGSERCRVSYHCDFTLPEGLKGRILKLLLGRSLDSGPADSLSRLKREAERRAGQISDRTG